MLVRGNRLIRCSGIVPSNRNGSKPYVTFACKKELSENSSRQNKALNPLKLFNGKLVVQSATAVFALGFIDAGYSGDWSRIGVISRETEDLLKVAALFVVPFCLFFIYSFSQKDED